MWKRNHYLRKEGLKSYLPRGRRGFCQFPKPKPETPELPVEPQVSYPFSSACPQPAMKHREPCLGHRMESSSWSSLNT